MVCAWFYPNWRKKELRNITLGVNQIKQAESYTAQHFSDDSLGDPDYSVNSEAANSLGTQFEAGENPRQNEFKIKS